MAGGRALSVTRGISEARCCVLLREEGCSGVGPGDDGDEDVTFDLRQLHRAEGGAGLDLNGDPTLIDSLIPC